jgi:hypothetical protein
VLSTLDRSRRVPGVAATSPTGIGTADAAQRERFLGSPTVRINGRDVEPEAERRTDYGLKCRLYRASTGLSGQPREELLQAALRSAAGAIG